MNPLTEERDRLALAQMRAAESEVRLQTAKRHFKWQLESTVKSPAFLLAAFSIGAMTGLGEGSSDRGRKSKRVGLLSRMQKLAVTAVSLVRAKDVIGKRLAGHSGRPSPKTPSAQSDSANVTHATTDRVGGHPHEADH